MCSQDSPAGRSTLTQAAEAHAERTPRACLALENVQPRLLRERAGHHDEQRSAMPDHPFREQPVAVPELARMMEGAMQTVISGSFRRHLGEIYALRGRLEAAGIIVLSPVGTHALNPSAEFVILDADPVHDVRLLQDVVFGKIRNSGFLVLANFDGYIGAAALIEVGYALAHGLQILTVAPVEDPNLAPYCRLLHDVVPAATPSRHVSTGAVA